MNVIEDSRFFKMIDANTTPLISVEKEYAEFILRWLAAKRDFAGMDIGPEPKEPEHRHPHAFTATQSFDENGKLFARPFTRKDWHREFSRSY